MIKGSIPTSDSRLLDAAETLVTLQSRGGGRGRQTGRIFKISHLKVGTTLGDTGCFRYQGIVKSTVSGVLLDLKFKISEGYRAESGQLQFWSKPSEILESVWNPPGPSEVPYSTNQ